MSIENVNKFVSLNGRTVLGNCFFLLYSRHLVTRPSVTGNIQLSDFFSFFLLVSHLRLSQRIDVTEGFRLGVEV